MKKLFLSVLLYTCLSLPAYTSRAADEPMTAELTYRIEKAPPIIQRCVRIAMQDYEKAPSLGAYDPKLHNIEIWRLSRAETAQEVRDKEGKTGNEAALPPGQEFFHIRLSRRTPLSPQQKGGGAYNAIIDPVSGSILDSYREA